MSKAKIEIKCPDDAGSLQFYKTQKAFNDALWNQLQKLTGDVAALRAQVSLLLDDANNDQHSL